MSYAVEYEYWEDFHHEDPFGYCSRFDPEKHETIRDCLDAGNVLAAYKTHEGGFVFEECAEYCQRVYLTRDQMIQFIKELQEML